MSRDRKALQLSRLLGIGYQAAYNRIKAEIERSGDKFSDVANRLIAEAEQGDQVTRGPA